MMGIMRTMDEPTYVIDPFPVAPGGVPRCEFKLWPTPDEVVFCTRSSVAVLTAPCCGAETKACRQCLDTMRGLGSWHCLGCGVQTDCRWQPMEFGIRWLT